MMMVVLYHQNNVVWIFVYIELWPEGGRIATKEAAGLSGLPSAIADGGDVLWSSRNRGRLEDSRI